MGYIFPIHRRNTHTIYNQTTLHLIGQCDVAMLPDGHFEYANYLVKFSAIFFENGIFEINGDSGVQNKINLHKKQ